MTVDQGKMKFCGLETTDGTPLAPNKRVNYAFGMVLGVDDFQQEQAHFNWKHRLDNLLLHGSGTVSGLQVNVHRTSDDVEIRVSPGYAVGPQGRWIWVQSEQCGQLNQWLQQQRGKLNTQLIQGPNRVYVTLCYDQCLTDPVPIAGTACNADEESLAPSRILETSKLRFTWQPPLQTLETTTRAFGDLLRELEIHQGPLSSLDSPDDSEHFIDRVKQLDTSSSPPLVSPPVPEVLWLWSATACDTLRRALSIWIKMIQPRLQETTEGCLLLASVDFNTDTDGNLMPGSVSLDDSARPLLVPGRLQQELFCLAPTLARPIDRLPYITTWLVLGPIFDPAHQLENHHPHDDHPRAGNILRDIDNHLHQLDPEVITNSVDTAPKPGDMVRYGGPDIAGQGIFPEQVYTWRTRKFGGLDWENISDIADNVHTHLSGDPGDDPFDPWNYLNFAGKHHTFGFFFVHILSPDVRTTRIRIRHDDALRVWLNGEEVRRAGVLPFLEDHDVVDAQETWAPIQLRQGRNLLLAAVAETHVEWSFTARIEAYRGLRFTTDIPWRRVMVPSTSQHEVIYIAGQGNYWNVRDPNRALSCIGGRIWKGRVTMVKEYYKFVADGNWMYNWGANGIPFGLNIWHDTPGIHEVIFDEADPGNPVFILVKPLSEQEVLS